MSRRNEQLTPELVKRLVRAIRENPNLADAADSCGVNPRSLVAWVKLGLYPNAEPRYHALAVAARRSRALLRGKLFKRLVQAATDELGDPKWAAWLLERMDEEGEPTWLSTIPGPGDMPQVRQHLFKNPSPQLLQDIDAAGFKLVPKDPNEPAALPPAVDGELEE